MNILITGYKGFIGINMVKAMEDHTLYLYEWGDKLDKKLFKKLDWVIHLGAISSTIETNVEKVYTQNVDFTLNLIALCKQYDVNLQYASSASVYGLNTDFSEDASKSPLSPYAWSKFIIDRYIENNYLNKSDKNILIQGLRYFNVYGPHEDHKGDQASPYHKFKKQAIETGYIKLFEGSENYRRDFIHVDTVCKIHNLMLDKDVCGIYNVGMGVAKSFLEVAEEIAEKHNAKINFIPMPEIIKKQYQSYTCADMTKLKGVLYGQNHS